MTKQHIAKAKIVSFFFFISSSSAYAQSGVNAYYHAPSSTTGKAVIVPTGTTFEGRINTTIGSSASKQGQQFLIEMTSPVLANGTDVLIPAGAEISGEVVEAVAASHVPHEKGVKPNGKLRIQITAIKMPDGNTYPMVASLLGEEGSRNHAPNPSLGGGMGYVGGQSNFEAVSPGRAYGSRSRNGVPHVVTKQELMQDPIYGNKDLTSNYLGEHYAIRSLVKKKRNLYIYQGSPVSVQLKAPLKIGLSGGEGAASLLNIEPPKDRGTHPRYIKDEPAKAEPTPTPPPQPTTLAPAFTPASQIVPPAPSLVPTPTPFKVPPSKAPEQPSNQGSNF